MSIPKKIHYCWFGGNPLPPLALKCIESWKKYLPDYEIKEWNESNFDVHCCKYVEEAYQERKWAFVSDYARFHALYNEGGVYFDTDIECLTDFDEIIANDAFFGFGRRSLTLPVFGANEQHPVISMILDDYHKRSFYRNDGSLDQTTIEITAEKILKQHYGLVMNGQKQQLRDGIMIYPKEYFSSTDWQTGIITRNPKLKVIHYADGSWLSDEEKLALKMRRKAISVFGAKLGGFVGTVLYLIKRDGIKGIYSHGMSFLRRKTAKPFMKVSRKLFAKKNRIVCQNFAGKGYGDNPKYIVEALLKSGRSYDIVWLVSEQGRYSFPKGVRTVKTNTFAEMFALATASVWIDNNRKKSTIWKAPDQFYIQTWHGFYPLKKLEKDAQDQLTPAYVESAKHDAQMTDLMVSGCKPRTNLYRTAFWYEGEIIECGSPRNDVLFQKNSELPHTVRRFFGLKDDVKVVLYAPTFRDNHSTAAYNINYHGLCDVLEQRFGGNWVCLVRLHPAVSHLDGVVAYDERVINASVYDDIQELFVAADLLVSDYSDCIFEFALTGKPVFMYASDLDEYTRTRDFYYNIRDLYYPLAQTNEELREMICGFDSEEYRVKNERFLKEICSYEQGYASQTIAERIATICFQKGR